MELNSILLQAAEPGQGSALSTIIMIVLMFAIMYFFMIRPNNKQRKETETFLASLTAGMKVMTMGGIIGTIKEVSDETVVLEIASNVKVTVNRYHVKPCADSSVKKES